jgi:hypothetical protein
MKKKETIGGTRTFSAGEVIKMCIELAELRAENKLLKSFNNSLIQALNKHVAKQT